MTKKQKREARRIWGKTERHLRRDKMARLLFQAIMGGILMKR